MVIRIHTGENPFPSFYCLFIVIILSVSIIGFAEASDSGNISDVQDPMACNEQCWISIDPIRDHSVDENFVITAKTNFSVNMTLAYTISFARQKPSNENLFQTNPFIGPYPYGTTKVVQGNKYNISSFEVRIANPDEYHVYLHNIPSYQRDANENFSSDEAFFYINKDATPVSHPYIIIEPIETGTEGDAIIFRGTTNAPSGTNLTIEAHHRLAGCQRYIYPSTYFAPMFAITKKDPDNPDISTFSYRVNTTGYNGFYDSTIYDPSQEWFNKTSFKLQVRTTSINGSSLGASPEYPVTPSSPFETSIILLSIVYGAFLCIRKKRAP